MSTPAKGNRDLADYLHERLRRLEQCNAKVEEKLCDDRIAFCTKIDEGVYSKNDPIIGQMVHHLEMVVGNTFRYTMLVGVCSFLEEAMKTITKRLVSDYETRIKSQRKGNWLRKHIRVLSDTVGLDVAPIQAEVNKFHDLITLRNCVVHVWGRLEEATNPDAVRQAAERVETAGISKDGYLVFGDQVVPEAIITGENIADEILKTKLQVSMT
jgi:hypothetical protein